MWLLISIVILVLGAFIVYQANEGYGFLNDNDEFFVPFGAILVGLGIVMIIYSLVSAVFSPPKEETSSKETTSTEVPLTSSRNQLTGAMFIITETVPDSTIVLCGSNVILSGKFGSQVGDTIYVPLK